MMTMLKSINNYFTDYKIVVSLFVTFLLLVTLLVFEIKIGLIVVVGAVLFAAALLRPRVIYFLLISLFSIDGFDVIPGATSVKLLGILLTIGLALRLSLTKESLAKDSSYKYFYLFFAGSIVSFAFSKELSVSLQIYVTYVSLFFLYMFTRHFLRSLDDIHKALIYIFFSTLFLFAYVQIIGLSVRTVVSRISSGIGDPNAFAAYLLVLIPLVLYRAIHSSGIPRLLYWGVLFSFMLLMVLTGSRGGILGFLGASAILIYYYGIGKMRQIVFFLIIVAMLALFFVPEDFWFRASTIFHPEAEQGNAISLRMHHYKAAVKMFLDNPIAGVGLYNFQFNNMEYGDIKVQVVHNMYLELLTGGGLLSFVPFCLILIRSWRNLRGKKHDAKEIRDLKIALKASFGSFLITSFFLSIDHQKIFWFLLALTASAYYLKGSARVNRVAGGIISR